MEPHRKCGRERYIYICQILKYKVNDRDEEGELRCLHGSPKCFSTSHDAALRKRFFIREGQHPVLVAVLITIPQYLRAPYDNPTETYRQTVFMKDPCYETMSLELRINACWNIPPTDEPILIEIKTRVL